MNCDKPLYPYIGMTDGCSVLAKVSISEKKKISCKKARTEYLTSTWEIKKIFRSSVHYY